MGDTGKKAANKKEKHAKAKKTGKNKKQEK
jgi:hypothetical protein